MMTWRGGKKRKKKKRLWQTQLIVPLANVTQKG